MIDNLDPDNLNPHFIEGFYNPEIQSSKEVPNAYPGNLSKEEFLEQHPDVADSIDATQFMRIPGDTRSPTPAIPKSPNRATKEEYKQWIAQYHEVATASDEWNISIPVDEQDYLSQCVEIRKRRLPSIGNQLKILSNLYYFLTQNPEDANALRLKHNNLGSKWIEIVEHLIALDGLKSRVKELLSDSSNIDMMTLDSAITEAFMRQVKLWKAQEELLENILRTKDEQQ